MELLSLLGLLRDVREDQYLGVTVSYGIDEEVSVLSAIPHVLREFKFFIKFQVIWLDVNPSTLTIEYHWYLLVARACDKELARNLVLSLVCIRPREY